LDAATFAAQMSAGGADYFFASGVLDVLMTIGDIASNQQSVTRILCAMHSLKRRILIIWLHRCLTGRLFAQVLILVVTAILARTTRSHSYRGIQLLTGPPLRTESLADIELALDLVARTDPRRSARIQQWIKRIVLADTRNFGAYWSLGRICAVKRLTHAGRVYAYAAVLVHESTHGLISGRGLVYSRSTRDRIERICRMEHKRFLALFPGGQSPGKPGLRR
jgi:hypothetical protein